MKLGVMIEGQEGIGWNEWREIVRWTEELGFESLWRSDHFFTFGPDKTKDALETFASLVYTAQNSSRIRFGPLVASMTFRHPAIVARMAAAIDQLSDGRFILGLGAGWNQSEHDAFGLTLPPVKERMDALEEGVQVVRLLHTKDKATFKGKVYQLKDAYSHPRPKQTPLPILVGGSGEKRTLRIVARYADEWNAAGARSIEMYREKRAVLEAHCEREKRDPKTIARSLMMGYVVGEDEKDYKRQASDFHGFFRPPSMDGGLDSLPLLAGTPGQVIETMQALEAEGVGRIMLQSFGMPSRDRLELIAREVLPKV